MNFTAYVEGKDDYRRGKDLGDNPFVLGSTEWLSWRKGWLSADAS